MSPPSENVRTTLKTIGPIVIVVGVLLIIFGILDERRAEERRNQQSREFMAGNRDIHDIDRGPPAGFFMIGGGMFAIVIGLGLLSFAFQQLMLRYQMRQYAPVVKEDVPATVKIPDCVMAPPAVMFKLPLALRVNAGSAMAALL